MTEMGGPLAFPIDLSTAGTMDELYDWYMRIDGDVVEAYAENVLVSALQENSTTKEHIAVQLMTLGNTNC